MHSRQNSRLVSSLALAFACALPVGCLVGPDSTEETVDEPLVEAQDALDSKLSPCGPAPACDPSIGPNDYRVSPSLVVSRITESIPGQTDDPILDKYFQLEDVVQQLLNQAGVSTFQTPDEWLARLWDTQNQTPGTFNESFQPHCSDNGQTINGFPIDCPRAEGQLASNVKTTDFFPIAVFNRFDLAPEDGSHCGEYRIVYAMENFTSGGVFGRNFIIFEAQLPNPNPSCGVEACRPVADFWASLSTLTSQSAIAKALAKFYYSGLSGFDPVIKLENYGLGGGGGGYGQSGGQIRTNQFVDKLWQLREFQLALECGKVKGDCRLISNPVTVKNNPFFDLFDAASTEPRAPSFQSSFTVNFGGSSQVSRLAVTHPNPITNLNLIAMDISDKFNAGQSTSQGPSEAYLPPFQNVLTSPFRGAIQTELTNIGSSLTPDEIVQRAEAQSCKGCHQISHEDPTSIGGGLAWPSSNGFTHVEENGFLSQALRCVFLPHRQAVGIGFLQNCGGNPAPIVPPDPDCKSFQGGGGGYGGPKKQPIDPLVVKQAADLGAPSPVKTLGGGSKVN